MAAAYNALVPLTAVHFTVIAILQLEHDHVWCQGSGRNQTHTTSVQKYSAVENEGEEVMGSFSNEPGKKQNVLR